MQNSACGVLLVSLTRDCACCVLGGSFLRAARTLRNHTHGAYRAWKYQQECEIQGVSLSLVVDTTPPPRGLPLSYEVIA
jgi:hypothetical protein